MHRRIYIIPVLIIGVIFAIQSCTPSTSDSSGVKETEDNTLSYDPVEMVNPLMGTDSKFSLSNGNTYPAIARPWGMNFWTPMTAKMGDGWTYKYGDNTIRGIKQTHQPSPWLNDYASFSLMAVTGELKYKEDERASWFSHKAETALPHYYEVYLADYDTKVEVTPTERSAMFRFTFPESEKSWILLDAFSKGSMVQIFPEERKIVGYSKYNHGGVPENFANYWVAEFDKDFELVHSWTDNWTLQEQMTEAEGDHTGAIIGFTTKTGEQVHVKVASSFISIEQAERNLLELGEKSFDEITEEGHAIWKEELGRIEITDDNQDHIETFYSCLYRVLLFPRKFYEWDEHGEAVHYSPYNGEVLPGYMYTDNGFWDTFRAVFPFFTLMYPDLNAEIMQGLANTYRESGWLPEWASPGHRNVMVGSNSAINIADAFLKGIQNPDSEVLYEAVIKNAEINEGRPMNSVGREGVDYYNSLGYVPYDVKINENAARTLEYAFADFNIAMMAGKMGKVEDSVKYMNRSYNYKNLFDPEVGWMRGKNEDGSFQEPFNPLKWGDAFTEGNSLHYTWSVFHDMEGLIEMMGGKDQFVSKLDTVFTMPPKFDDSYYGFTIHEIREMQIVNMGNYAHGNQPIQHMIYLYNHAGESWKSQLRVREVMEKLYQPTPDGYCGDEDNGQTSAWYVFSALGFYPVTPGTPQYVIGSPLFDKAVIHPKGGEPFTILAEENGKETVYIEEMKLNGKPYTRTWLDHFEIRKGGTWSLQMSADPNSTREYSRDDMPYSLSASKN